MSGLDMMKIRANYHGGGLNDANVVGKYRSFLSAVNNSYLSEEVTLYDRDFKQFKQKQRCLINPDKITMDYDQKEISIGFDSGLKTGDVFYWNETKTYWLVLKQELTEKAYFRGTIRRCAYEIMVNGKPYRLALRGPVETTSIWKQKNQINFNELNYSLLVYIEANEETKSFFTRHKVVKFDGHNWVVEATDKYSQHGILEVYLKESYDNAAEDIAAAAPEIVIPDSSAPHIKGPGSVNPYDKGVRFFVYGMADGIFSIDSKKVKITETTADSCTLDVVTGRSGSFVIKYSNGITTLEQEIIINSI